MTSNCTLLYLRTPCTHPDTTPAISDNDPSSTRQISFFFDKSASESESWGLGEAFEAGEGVLSDFSTHELILTPRGSFAVGRLG